MEQRTPTETAYHSMNLEFYLNQFETSKFNQAEITSTSFRESFEETLLKHPIKTEKAFAQFGLMLGIITPFSIFSKFIWEISGNLNDYWIVALLMFSNAVCGFTGFHSGKLIGRLISDAEKYSWAKMLVVLPFIGLLWGIMTGAAGGVFIFIIGAFFGAAIASFVGAAAVTSFTILHRLLRKGDSIEYNQFLPIALGVTFIISAFFLGLNF